MGDYSGGLGRGRHPGGAGIKDTLQWLLSGTMNKWDTCDLKAPGDIIKHKEDGANKGIYDGEIWLETRDV